MDYQPEILMQFPYFVLITKHFICDNLQMYDSWIDVFPLPLTSALTNVQIITLKSCKDTQVMRNGVNL